MFGNWKSTASGIGVCLLAVTGANAQTLEYQEPQFDKRILGGSMTSLPKEDRDALVEALVATAQSKDSSLFLSSMALAYANGLDSGRWDVAETNFYLKNGQQIPPDRLSSGDPSDLKDLISVVKEANGPVGVSVAMTYFEDIITVMEDGITEGSPLHQRWMRVFVETNQASTPAAPTVPRVPSIDTSLPVQEFAKSRATMAGVYYGDVELSIPDDATMIEQRWMIQKAMRSMKVEARVEASSGGPTSIELANDRMPPELSSAMHEMVKMFSLRNLAIPTGNQIQVTFDEGYIGADGPTAVLACAILVDALVAGTNLDRTFAAAGDLNADGSIQPVYSLDVRLRTAKDSHVEILAIPDANAKRLGDIVLNDEGELLLKTQVFTVKDFDEAKAVAAAPDERDQQLQEAITTFAEVQKALNRPNSMSYLRNPQVRERLQKTLQLAPNHASARLLLLKGANRNPQKLTLVGSISEIQHAAVFLQDGKSPRYDNFRAAIGGVGSKRDALDPRCLDWFSAMSNYNTLANQGGSSLSGAQRDDHRVRVDQAQKRIDLEYQKLMSNPGVREALMAK